MPLFRELNESHWKYIKKTQLQPVDFYIHIKFLVYTEIPPFISHNTYNFFYSIIHIQLINKWIVSIYVIKCNTFKKKDKKESLCSLSFLHALFNSNNNKIFEWGEQKEIIKKNSKHWIKSPFEKIELSFSLTKRHWWYKLCVYLLLN